MKSHSIFQFKIALEGVAKPIWWRIQVPNQYTFWDLHVAIQDAMGWTDSHLHEFTVINPTTLKKEYIGIPDDEGFDDLHPVLAGWEIKIKDYVQLNINKRFSYLYDFVGHASMEVTLKRYARWIPDATTKGGYRPRHDWSAHLSDQLSLVDSECRKMSPLRAL